jgi:hypothetical protein
MSDSTPRLGLPDLPDTPELYAETVSDAFWRLDALIDLCLKGQFVDAPPSSPADGDAWLTGGAPSGAWTGQAYKIAACRDGGWQFLAPFDGLRAWVEDDGCFIVYRGGGWTDWNSLISAAESNIASAASCDIGAAGSMFLQVTGASAITSFGTVANRLRFLRFAGSLTLTHDAGALVLPGGADIVTAAGDTALFASDGSGNWRCRHYSRASGLPVSLASPTVTGTLTAAAANFSGLVTRDAGASQEANRIVGTGAFNTFYDDANATRLGYVQGNISDLTIQAKSGSSILGVVNATTIQTINAVGVGIGKAPANYTFDSTEAGTNGNWGRIGALYLVGGAAGAYPSVGFNMRGTGAGNVTFNYNSADYASWTSYVSGQVQFYVAPSGSAASAISPTLAAMAANDGSFLVGTTTPTGAGTIGTQVYTVGTLPAGARGARAFVSDAASSSFNAAAAGGGANNVPVFHDGSGWRIG